TGAPGPSDLLSALDSALQAADARIATLEADAHARGETLRLERLSELFGLSALERAVLVICLAAEISLKYERLYAYLQDDVTKKRPTVDLVMRLLCTTTAERVAARRCFEPEAPLVRWELISLHDDPNARRPVLVARYLKMDERIARYLLGVDEPDARLQPLVRSLDGSQPSLLTPPVASRLQQWAGHWQHAWHDRPPVVLLHGRYGTGKAAAAHALASALRRPLFHLDALDMNAKGVPLAQALKWAEREALLCEALLCWDGVDALLQPPPGGENDHRHFTQWLAHSRVPAILLAHKGWEPASELERRPFLRI